MQKVVPVLFKTLKFWCFVSPGPRVSLRPFARAWKALFACIPWTTWPWYAWNVCTAAALQCICQVLVDTRSFSENKRAIKAIEPSPFVQLNSVELMKCRHSDRPGNLIPQPGLLQAMSLELARNLLSVRTQERILGSDMKKMNQINLCTKWFKY